MRSLKDVRKLLKLNKEYWLNNERYHFKQSTSINIVKKKNLLYADLKQIPVREYSNGENKIWQRVRKLKKRIRGRIVDKREKRFKDLLKNFGAI